MPLRFLTFLLPLCLAPAALASIPGGGDSMNQNYYEGILHVCKDTEPDKKGYVVCNEQVGNVTTGAYTASECTDAGLPPVCVADFVPWTKVRLLLTLIVDDDAKDSNDQNDGRHSGITLQGRYRGEKILLSDLFLGSKIGNWNDFSEAELVALENIIYSAEPGDPAATWEIVYQISIENLADLGDRLLEIVDAKLTKIDLAAEGVVAVITDVRPFPKKGSSDESTTTIGSTSIYKIVIEFARVRN